MPDERRADVVDFPSPALASLGRMNHQISNVDARIQSDEQHRAVDVALDDWMKRRIMTEET